MTVFFPENLSLEWWLVSGLAELSFVCLLEVLGCSLVLPSGQSRQPAHLGLYLLFSNSPAFTSRLIPAWQGASPLSTTTQWPRRDGTPSLPCVSHTCSFHILQREGQLERERPGPGQRTVMTDVEVSALRKNRDQAV